MSVGYLKQSVRASAVLTDTFDPAATIAIDTQSYGDGLSKNQMFVLISFTKGSLTSGEVRLQFSDDNITNYQDTNASTNGATTTLSLGEYTFTATGNYIIEKPIKYKYLVVSAKGTGTVTNSLMAIDLITAHV